MDATGKLTTKGQVTIPKAVREALDLRTGDQIHFRVAHSGATMTKTPDFLELAGSVPVPADRRGTPWEEILRRSRDSRTAGA